MNNPFARPGTTREWLRSSLCWTGASLGAWWLGYLLIDNMLRQVAGGLLAFLMPVGFCVAHVLIWRRAVAGGRAIIRHDEQHHDFSWTRLAANLWLVALTLFQVAGLLSPLLLIGWVLLRAGSVEPSTSGEPFFG
ncbi:hypothetical protein QMK33_10210 [Hymenobacter sp. H14-R3]|uniref:hypothetical protein n=1 Tax=Hymenobacter sp. H14-R3 TaxID=3046308 RepID=UPI0024BB12A7|nr:hypothetical protein [Hymenobacter sp. H14-R3]MDJ0365528.1 hypothetical protein [Hymenobacter sp. H14-R3]